MCNSPVALSVTTRVWKLNTLPVIISLLSDIFLEAEQQLVHLFYDDNGGHLTTKAPGTLRTTTKQLKYTR